MIPYKDLNPSRRFPFVTVLLIGANAALFLYEILLPAASSRLFIEKFAVIPLEFTRGGNFLTVFTAMFLHGGWFHLIGNMLTLWIFGDNVEARMGSFRFLLFYLLCGIVATVAQIYSDTGSSLPSLGASGAIAGILAAYLRMFPEARIAVLVPVFYFLRVVILPAWLVIGLWIVLQLVQFQLVQGHAEGGGTAYFAHLGGFVSGFLFRPLFVRRKRR